MARLPQINCKWPNQSLRLEINLTNLINHDFDDSLLGGVDLLLLPERMIAYISGKTHDEIKELTHFLKGGWRL